MVSSRTDIVKKFQEPESLSFDRTEIVVALSKFGHETLIARSQAKRITQGLKKFREVTLDFTNVRLVGQGFVDEIFRVFSNKHPEIKIHYIHANEYNQMHWVERRVSNTISRDIA